MSLPLTTFAFSERDSLLLKVVATLSMADGKFFDYHHMKEEKEAIIAQLHAHGFVAIVGVPGREEIYEAFLKELQAFISLSDAEKKQSTPDN